MDSSNAQLRKLLLICAGLSAGIWILYFRAAGFEFVGYDDPFYVFDNPHINQGITKEGLAWAFGRIAGEATYWHPLTWFSHMIDCHLFGINPGAHHLVSVGFHTANVLLLFWLIFRMTGAMWRSAAVAALFALHPLQVESVAWVTERKNLLSTLFLILTLLAYVRYVEQPRLSRYAAVMACFALGLMSKPMLVTLPCVLLLLDFWPLGRLAHLRSATPRLRIPDAGYRQLLLEKVPLFLLSAISSYITISAHHRVDSFVSEDQVTLVTRLANALVSYVRYIGKTFWPADLAAIYPFSSWSFSHAAGALMILVVITVLAILLARQRPYVLVGWLWFLGTLVPVIGIVQVGSQAMADRFAYVPLIGLFWIVVWGIADLTANLPERRQLRMALAAIALAGCFTVSWLQLAHWENSLRLFNRTLAVTKNNPIAHYNFGLALAQQGRTPEAKAQFMEAVRISSGYTDARNNLAAILLSEGRVEEALAQYEAALKTNPRHPLVNFNFATVLEQRGALDEALRHYRIALEQQPRNPEFHIALASVAEKAGDLAQCLEHSLAALRLNPKSPEAHHQLGNALFHQQQIAPANAHYQEAIRLQPGHAEARFNLALTLLMLDRTAEAVPHFAAAAKLKPDFAEGYIPYGLGLVALGRVEEAVEKFRQALHLQPDLVPALLHLGWIFAAHENRAFRDGAEAMRLGRHAASLTAQPETLDLLAAALAEGEQFDEATATARRAIELARTGRNENLASEIEARLELYQQQLPYRRSKFF